MKMNKLFFILTVGLSSTYLSANDDIVGKWRNIDDKTGFSKAVIEITKDANDTYFGKIIEVTPRPGYTPKAYCDKCKGADQGKPIIGLQIIKHMKRSTQNPLEFSQGTILDPLTGSHYKSTMRLNTTGTRLAIRGFVGIEALGRSQTWLRQN